VAQPPGTLTLIGEKQVEKVTITRIDYNKDTIDESQVENVSTIKPPETKSTVSWINVTGIHDIEVIQNICNNFSIHPLVQEDILNTMHRPKVEELEDYMFIVLKMLYYEEEELNSEHISLILGPNYVISFQEREKDVFAPVRERLHKGRKKLRESGSDYLAYVLVDAIVDHSYFILEDLAEKLEGLEDEIVYDPKPELLQHIHSLKGEMIFLRRAMWPIREMINEMLRSESKLIKKTTNVYFRDVYDHTIGVMETIETFRDIVAGFQDLFLSSVSNKMNEIMKTLTIMATIFIPLTFIAGIYGMNFEFMPELKWKFGYFGIWGFMVVVVIFMFFIFKRKRWF
jgi:magnesium transporter